MSVEDADRVALDVIDRAAFLLLSRIAVRRLTPSGGLENDAAIFDSCGSTLDEP